MTYPTDGFKPSEEDLSALDATQLYARRQDILGELGHLELEFEKRRAQKRRLVRSDELQWKAASEMNPTKASIQLCQIVSPELGFDILNMHMFRIRIPAHTEGGKYHRHGDAIKYYVRGRAVEMIGDETYEVGPGDYIHIPANVYHGTQNPFDEECEILAVQQFPGTYSQFPAPFMWE
jgi:mannose-6-phosphate isomerase-like protein (cupin superfamily)